MSYFLDNVDEIRDAINILEKAIAELDGGVSVNVDTLTGTGETGRDVMKAPTPEKARDAIGAGTSSLKLGSTATTAMPGNTTIPTVPAALSAADATKGTSTVARTITAKVLSDFVNERIAAAKAAG